jgi:beta-lactamase regulating signal transducer with metallopeptidase domain
VFAGGTFLYYQNKDKESVLIVEKYGQAVSQPITPPSEVTETRAIPEKSVITTRQNLDENPWYLPYLVYAYFLGLFILGFRLLAGILYLKKLKTKGLRMPDTNMESRFLRLLDKFTMKRKVEIRESILTKVPMVLGYFKPLIIVPAGTFAHIPFNQMEAILAHELAHIQRNDFIQNIIQTLIELLFFYHPLVYLISSRIRKERENCCDDIKIVIQFIILIRNNFMIHYLKKTILLN